MKKTNLTSVNLIIFAFFLFYGCSSLDQCNQLEQQVKNNVDKTDTVFSIPLSNLTDFEWDKLFIIIGPRFPGEVKEIIEHEYNKTVEDDSKRYIFMKDGSIVKDISSYCNGINFRKNLTKNKGVVKYNFFDTMNIKVLKSDDNYFYWIK